jgi:hypothetical protein
MAATVVTAAGAAVGDGGVTVWTVDAAGTAVVDGDVAACVGAAGAMVVAGRVVAGSIACGREAEHAAVPVVTINIVTTDARRRALAEIMAHHDGGRSGRCSVALRSG